MPPMPRRLTSRQGSESRKRKCALTPKTRPCGTVHMSATFSRLPMLYGRLPTMCRLLIGAEMDWLAYRPASQRLTRKRAASRRAIRLSWLVAQRGTAISPACWQQSRAVAVVGKGVQEGESWRIYGHSPALSLLPSPTLSAYRGKCRDCWREFFSGLERLHQEAAWHAPACAW